MKKLFLGLFTSHAGGLAGAGLEDPYQGSPQAKSPDYSATSDKGTTELKIE